MSDIETEQDELPQEETREEESPTDDSQQVDSPVDDATNDAMSAQSDDGESDDGESDDGESDEGESDERASEEDLADDEVVADEVTAEEVAADEVAEGGVAEQDVAEEENNDTSNDELASEPQPTSEHVESPAEEPADNVSASPKTAPGPDLDQVDAAEWPEREFPVDGQRQEGAVCVVIKQSAINKIHQHGLSDTDVEICGVMIGNGYRDSHGPFVYIEDIIKGKHSESLTAQVTFTAETWNHIHNELDNEHPDLRILGWYHTHPGFGIFLSGMDLFIHENYFSADEQLALVYDPIGGDEGLFIWRAGEATRDKFVLEPDTDDIEETPDQFGSEPLGEIPEGYGEEEALIARIERLEQRQWSMMVTIFALALFALASPMITWVFFIEPKLPEIFEGLRPAEKSPALPFPISDPDEGPRAEPPHDSREETKKTEPPTTDDFTDDDTEESVPNP